jgi:Ca2+-binding EF-hand superfamily protein
MTRFHQSSLTTLGALALAATVLAQTQPGSANAVDPYAPTQTPNATTSQPAPQVGTDTPVSTPITVDAQVQAAKLARMDSDKDGRVSLAEFTTAYNESRIAGTNQSGMSSGTGDATVVFKEIDADGDSFLSATELADADTKQLKKK